MVTDVAPRATNASAQGNLPRAAPHRVAPPATMAGLLLARSKAMTPDDAQVLEPGTILGDKYVVESCLAQGGMGTIYYATNLDLEAPVALKVMRRFGEGADDEIFERTIQEAKLAAKLRGEHIARVLDAGRLADGGPYIVMEYLDGKDLRQLLDDGGPLDVSQAVHFIQQACIGLAEAHDHGIVHRDLKPENLFLAYRPDGSTIVKLLDFGISKSKVRTTGRRLTGPNSVLGSPDYMSPEQLDRPETVDERADVWALGCVLFELLTGATPFEGSTPAVTCSRALQCPMPSIRERRPEVPDRLEQVVRRCLEKDRVARFASVAVLSHALSEFTSADGTLLASRASATSQPPPRAPEPSCDSLEGAVHSLVDGDERVLHDVWKPRRAPQPMGWLAIAAALIVVVVAMASPTGERVVDAVGSQLTPPLVQPLSVGVTPIVAEALGEVAAQFAEVGAPPTEHVAPTEQQPTPPNVPSGRAMVDDGDIYAPLDRLY